MQHASTQISQEMQECIYNCLSCHAICLETITECLAIGGKHAEASHLKLLQDCVQICMANADFMLRGSCFYTSVSRVCAEICEQCVINCKRMSVGNDFMTRCAEACHRSAESCQRMSLLAVASSASV